MLFRISTLVYEERSVHQCLQVVLSSKKQRAPGCSWSILRSLSACRRDGGTQGEQLLLSLYGTHYHPTCSSCDTCQFCRHDRAADVRHQHHRLLFFDYSAKQALIASWGFGPVSWPFAFPAVWTIDTFGRRNLLLFTFPNMAWTLLAAGSCFFIPETSGARLPLVVLFIFLAVRFFKKK